MFVPAADNEDRWRGVPEGPTGQGGVPHPTKEITISALVFLMPLPLSSSVSTAGEALNLKLDCSLTNDQSM